MSSSRRRSSRGTQISPTAHYTGHTWVHHGLSDPELDTPTGRLFFYGLFPLEQSLKLVGGPSIEGFLLSRHRAIDAELHKAIDDGSVTQVVEVACGLSPRGLRFHRNFGNQITYIEADLVDMARLKEERLERAGSLDASHRVMVVDALVDDGPTSLNRIMDSLDPTQGTAIITEGLINYFDQETAESMFTRFARALERFPTGLYLTDLYLAGDNSGPLSTVFSSALSVFVRGRVHVFYADEAEVASVLQASGFEDASAIRASDHPGSGDTARNPGARLVRVVRATI